MRSSCLLGLVLAACVGEAPPLPDPDGAGGDVPVQGQRVSGKVLDYFGTAGPLVGAMVTSDGIVPALTSMTATDGTFAFDTVPVGSQVFFSASRTSYRATRNLVTVADTAVQQDLYLMSTTDINRQYTTGGKTPTAGRAFVIAELQRNNGTPLAGVPLTDVKILDGVGAPVAGAFGPYVLGDTGDILLASTQTELHAGKSRVAFLDVPAGTFSLRVAFLDGQNQPQALTTPVTTTADGATLVRSGGGGAGTGTGTSGAPANPHFKTDIYPRLQTAANGGRGCANCHTVGGQGAVQVFNALASDVLLSLKAKTGLIDTTKPAQSLLLTKPLYEQPPLMQNHPNATFVDPSDPDYKLILLWIQQGAAL